MSFQIHLEPEEYVDCIVSDQSTNFICLATSIRQRAHRLVFCEVIGEDEVFLVQSLSHEF